MPHIILLVLLAIRLPAAVAWEALSADFAVRCRQPEYALLTCEYRVPQGGDARATLTTDAGTVTPRTQQPYPWAQARTALLLLVDTSDPGRAAIVARNVEQVAEIAQAARSHQQIGLARFDKDLEVLAPLGSSAAAVAGAARRLRASGMTTELYHNVLRAVRSLAAAEADRRFLVVFSDGLAEDTAYFHEDVIDAARAAGVGIMSLGFPRSVARSVALQSLRRLSEETGGIYIEAGVDGVLPPRFARTLLASADSGARVEFALPPLRAHGSGEPGVTFLVQLGARQIRHEIPVRLPPAPGKAAGPPAVIAPAAQVRATPSPALAPETNRLLWYGVPAALLLLILLAMITLVLLYRQPRRTAAVAPPPAPGPKPFAYLISQTSHPKRFPILGAIWRIGRSRENELVLDDISISRRHAEIQRATDGRFHLVDRGSKNGIFVNGRQIRQHVLQEGDMIEIGDVVLRFTEAGPDEQLQEQTAMQRTRQPRIA